MFRARGWEPPNDTEIEREKGVNDVRMFGVIEVRSAENGLNANGTTEIMRRGTASHKTELSDEWVDLGKAMLAASSAHRLQRTLPITRFQFSCPPGAKFQPLSDTHCREYRILFFLGDGQNTDEPPRKPSSICWDRPVG